MPEPLGRRLEALRQAGERGDAAAVDRAWNRILRVGVPLVERLSGPDGGSRVTFLWRPDKPATEASVTTTVTSPTRDGLAMALLPGTGVWYRSFRLPRGTRATYAFTDRLAPGPDDPGQAWGEFLGSLTPDPHESAHIALAPHPDDPEEWELRFSVLELPGASREPWSHPSAAPPMVEGHHRFRSAVLRNERSVWIVRPPSFDPHAPHNLLVLFDGPIYRTTIPTPSIVSNLVRAGKIGPTVLLLVTTASGAREVELAGNPRFAEMLGTELLPWLRRRYRVTAPPERTVVGGSSLGGLAAAAAALRYPRRFGNVLAQSGAFAHPVSGRTGTSTTIAREFARSPRRDIRFHLQAGTFEWSQLPPGGDISLLGSVRAFRDVLEAKGYPVRYTEFSGGHDYACWRAMLPAGILDLLGRAR